MVRNGPSFGLIAIATCPQGDATQAHHAILEIDRRYNRTFKVGKLPLI